MLLGPSWVVVMKLKRIYEYLQLLLLVPSAELTMTKRKINLVRIKIGVFLGSIQLA